MTHLTTAKWTVEDYHQMIAVGIFILIYFSRFLVLNRSFAS